MNKKLNNSEKLIGFLSSIFLLILMLYVASEDLKTGFFYYLLISVLSIAIVSYSIIYLLKNIIKGLKFLCKKIKLLILYSSTKLKNIKFSSLTIMFLATLGWLSFIFFLIWMQKGDFDFACLLNMKFDGLSLNEWGDFLAGFIAPVALGWLAYSIFYQKKEFENVKEAFVDQQDILKDQVTKLEIDQLHTWFERNTSRINVLLAKIQKEKISNNDTPQLINEDFSLITQESKYFEIFDEIRNILKINEFILSSLIESSKNKEVNKAIRELLIEYQLLYGEHIKFSKIILLKVYLCIAMHEKEIKGEFKYVKYKVYSDWLTKDLKDKIIELVNSQESKLIEEQINLAFEKIYLNFDWISINKE